MIASGDFLKALKGQGVDSILSLPCSFFSGLLAEVAKDPELDHIPVTSEAEAVGIASGLWLAGRKPAIVIQNSGFLDALNPICSLLETFAIPIPFIVSVRGGFGVKDEPQHDLTGQRFLNILDSVKLGFTVLNDSGEPVESQLRRMFRDVIGRRKAGVIAVPPKTLAPKAGEPKTQDSKIQNSKTQGSKTQGSKIQGNLADPPMSKPALPLAGTDFNRRGYCARPTGMPGDCGSRSEVLNAICESAPDDSIFVCSTGFIGRDLYALGDAPSRLYVAGSMGCASAIGFGISRYTSRPVIVLDGDGAALMRMGNFATIGNADAGRLLHIIMNNGVFESTGGQFNYGRNVDFAAISKACGYSRASVRVSSRGALRQLVAEHGAASDRCKPILLDTMIAARSPKPDIRPAITPPDQALRLQQFLKADEALLMHDA